MKHLGLSKIGLTLFLLDVCYCINTPTAVLDTINIDNKAKLRVQKLHRYSIVRNSRN